MPRAILILIGAALAASVVVAPVAAASDDLAAARQATARYHDIRQADGYGEFRDAQGIACIAQAGQGTMGIHYVNGSLVGDATVDATTPEALVYEPGENGKLQLVALEYIVFQTAWDAAHASPPSLFGHDFHLVTSPNRYGLPPFYELHAWLWKPNPSGTFYEWNPNVSCG
jgi:hypothetical protein